jgi:hypothetical protein
VKDFLERHWGDFIALYLLHMGVLIVWLAHSDADIAHTGEALMATGLVSLRFKGRDIQTSEVRDKGTNG